MLKLLCIILFIGLGNCNEIEKFPIPDVEIDGKNYQLKCNTSFDYKGCECKALTLDGEEITVKYIGFKYCSKPTFEKKKNLFNDKYIGNCWKSDKKGCHCFEFGKDKNQSIIYYTSEKFCKEVMLRLLYRTPREAVASISQKNNQLVRDPPREKAQINQNNDQNVRDPIRERAQKNHAAVINELKNKFRGLREGCYPRPKGCLCVIGKNIEGLEITERRLKDVDCKCGPNEKSNDCPAPGA